MAVLLTLSGSSPQARGTRLRAATHPDRNRFIPAGAGNASVATAPMPAAMVHPRRRGERGGALYLPNVAAGSSPQARGTLLGPSGVGKTTRFIPAGAGNASHLKKESMIWPVHPRRRGERGVTRHSTENTPGSSPQARGTPLQDDSDVVVRRFIPAGAGNALPSRPTRWPRSVHPRRRGERGLALSDQGKTYGSSPQARGTPRRLERARRALRFIPAGAGNAVVGPAGSGKTTVHPRRRGERGFSRRIG